MNKIKASYRLTLESLKLLNQDSSLVLFPLCTLFTLLVGFAAVGYAVFFYYFAGNIDLMMSTMQAQKSTSYTVYSIMFLLYLLSYFVINFFQAGLISTAYALLRGEKTSFGAGVKNATRHFIEILFLSLIESTVGVLIQFIFERSSYLGKIVVRLLGAAWGLVIFFIIPVIIIDEVPVFASFAESMNVFKKTWGETLIVDVSVGIIFTLVSVLAICLCVCSIFFYQLTMYWTLILVVCTVFVVITLAIVSATLDGIIRVVLYEYAKTGAVPGNFDQQLITGVLSAKR